MHFFLSAVLEKKMVIPLESESINQPFYLNYDLKKLCSGSSLQKRSFIKKFPLTPMHEWPRQNFSLQYQYNIKHTSDEKKEKHQLGDYKWIQYQIL